MKRLRGLTTRIALFLVLLAGFITVNRSILIERQLVETVATSQLHRDQSDPVRFAAARVFGFREYATRVVLLILFSFLMGWITGGAGSALRANLTPESQRSRISDDS